MQSTNYFKINFCRQCNRCRGSNQELFLCLVNKLAEFEKEKTELTTEGMK